MLLTARKYLAACLLVSAISGTAAVSAFETDQYNLPPVPLADIGEEVSEYVEGNIRTAIRKLNAEIEVRQHCIDQRDRKGVCGSVDNERHKLVYLRSDAALAREVFQRLGSGIIPFTRSQTWMNSHKFRGQPARYRTSYRDSIFVLVPTDYVTISPTVNLYGSSFGTDKIAHFFQQGFGYFGTRREAIKSGQTEEAATLKAIKQGITAERTYFGMLVSGVFSNGDLAANYAGMKFYEGLTADVQLGGLRRPHAAEVAGGFWRFNEDVRPHLFRPFISDHLNEALNPSIFAPILRSSVRRIVRKRSCTQWRQRFPTRTRSDYETETRNLVRWYGEEYGHRESTKFVSIANTCF